MDLQVGRAQFADGLLEEVQWWILQTTDQLDARHPDRPALIAAAVQVEWLREQLGRLLGTRGEPVDVGASVAPPAPGRLRGRYASLYQLDFLLGKVHGLARLLSGDDGRAVGGWVDGFLGDLQVWDGRIGEMRGDGLVSIAVSMEPPIVALQKWAGQVRTLDAAYRELFPCLTATELFWMFRDEERTSPQLDWVRWAHSSASEYTMPPVSDHAHCVWLDVLLSAYQELAVSIAEGVVAIETADRDRLHAAAAYAAWLRDGAQWEVARAAATSAPPWVTPQALPTPQWPTTPPPARPEPLGQWYPELAGLPKLAGEILWVRNRVWPSWSGQELNAGDPYTLTVAAPSPLKDRW